MSGNTGNVETDTQLLAEASDGRGAGPFTLQNIRNIISSETAHIASADADGMTSTATGGSAVRTMAGRFGDIINVRDFGAVGMNDGTDDTAAINAAFAYARSKIDTTVNNTVYFPPGVYKTTGPINMTGFGSTSDWYSVLTVIGWGAKIECHHTGGAAIDMMGSRWVTLLGLTVKGDATNTPAFGLQIGRLSQTQTAGEHYFDHLTFIGSFSTTAVYIFASEVNQWNALHIENQVTSNAYCLIIDSSWNWSCTSTFATLSNTQGTIASCFENKFIACHMFSSSTNVSVAWINGSGRVWFDMVYMTQLSTGTTAITLDMTDPANPIRDLIVDAHFENNPNLATIFLLTNSAFHQIMGLKYHDQNCQASTSIFKLGTGSTGALIWNLDMNIPTCWDTSPYPQVFDTPASYNVTGKVWVPAQSMWTTPAVFWGDIQFGSDGGTVPGAIDYSFTSAAHSMSGDRGDAAVTLTWGVDNPVQLFATALTANRTITLSTTNAVNGSKFRIVRTGGGAFTLSVGGVKTMPASTAAWCEVDYNGSAWHEIGYGTL